MAFRMGIADFGDSWSAVVFDLPGCTTTAADRASLLRVVPPATGEYGAWLCRAGEAIEVPARIEVEIAEEVRVADLDGVQVVNSVSWTTSARSRTPK